MLHSRGARKEEERDWQEYSQPIKNKVTTEETGEFLKTIQKVDYKVIQ